MLYPPQSPAINIAGMTNLGGSPSFGAPDAGHPANAQTGAAPGYKIPPAAWGIAFLVLGYILVRWILED